MPKERPRRPASPQRRPGTGPEGAPPGRSPGGPSRNVRLLLEYEGTRYAGWQVQQGQRTVAGEILSAIRGALGEAPKLIGAGRTDQGVHAEGQVANFFTRSKLPAPSIAESLNGILPADINILEARDAPMSFHARHDAAARRYRYQIASRRSAFFKRLIWWVRQPLDQKAMEEAARALVGRHDFTSFADKSATIAEPRVRVFQASLRRGDFITSFSIEADHFLPRMVRRIVGVLVQIGLHNLPAEAMGRFLSEIVDDPAAWTSPPSGLFLERVLYPGDSGAAPAPRPAGSRPPT